jgi:hypothetical protein
LLVLVEIELTGESKYLKLVAVADVVERHYY